MSCIQQVSLDPPDKVEARLENMGNANKQNIMIHETFHKTHL